MRKINYVILILALVFTEKLFAKVEILSTGVFTGTTLQGTSNLALSSSVTPLSAGNPFFKKAYIDIKFGLFDMQNIFLDQCKAYRIEYTYTTTDIFGNSTAATTETLDIHYNPEEGKNYNHTAVARKENAYKIKIANIKVFVLDSGVPGCNSYLLGVNYDVIYFECVVNTEYYYPMPNSPSLQPNGVKTQVNASCNAKLKVTVPQLLEAEEYELEYLWKFNEYNVLSSLPGRFDFGMEATRIKSLTNTFEIPIIYDEGFVFFRYRYVGRNNNSFFTDPVESSWSVDGTDAFGEAANFIGSTYYNGTVFPDNNEKNYTFSQTFFGLEMPKSSITYLDGLGRARQTLTTINFKSGYYAYKSIFQTHEFDYAGRVAVEFMPAPSIENCFKLQTDQNITTFNNTTFDKEEFDIEPVIDPCSFDPFELETDRIANNSPLIYEHRDAANYYSENNQLTGENVFIPDAFGYPYKQIQYRKDPFNTPAAVGSVGKVFQLGTGHESRMFIGNVSNSELDQLFHGEQAPPTFYKKVVNVDPNGQTTFNILDFDGRTVVSGINGQAPKGMDDLVDPAPTSSVSTIDLIQDYNETNHSNFTTTISYDQVVAEANTVIDITYDFQGAVFDTSCAENEIDCQSCINPQNLCFTCLYEMEIKVEDPCGVIVYQSPAQPVGSPQYLGTPLMTATTSPVPQNCQVGFDYDLPVSASFNAEIIGEYHISKILKVSETPIQDYWNQYVQTACCIIPECQFIEGALGQLNVETCIDECSDCQEILYRISLPASDPLSYAYLPGVVITNINNHCNAICTTTVNPSISSSICENELKALKFDFYPGGQYADYEVDINGNYTAPDDLSILNPSFNFNGLTYSYFWDNLVGGGAINWTLEQKVTQFNLSWTNYAVTYHPEYKYYEFCLIVDQTGSHDYDALMLATETMSEAISSGLIKPLPNAPVPSPICSGGCTQNFDPFFTDPSPELTSFTTYMNTPFVGYGNMYQMSVEEVEGQSTTVDFGDNVNCNRDFHWKAFRKRYLDAKKWFLGDLRTKFVTENGCINSAIGSGQTPPVQVYNPNVSIYSFPFTSTIANYQFALSCYETNPPTNLSFLDITSSCATTCTTGTESYVCDQKFISGGSSWNSNLALKDPHYLGTGQLMAMLGITPNNPSTWGTMFSNGAQLAADNCAASCAQMVPVWIDLMDDCQAGYINNGLTFQAAVNAATAEMLEICQCACDFEHPNGASNVPNVNDFTAPYDQGSPWHYTTVACSTLNRTTFTQVFDHYFPDRDAVNCPNMGVTFPQSYDDGNVNNLVPHSFLDTCACNTLLSAQQEYNAMVVANNNTPPFHFQSLKDFIRVKYYIDLQNIEQIKCYCEKTWDALNYDSNSNSITPWAPGENWPSNGNNELALSNYSVPASISCGDLECKNCDYIIGSFRGFFTNYLGVDPGTNVLLTHISDGYANDANFETNLYNYLTQTNPFYTDFDVHELLGFYYHCIYSNGWEMLNYPNDNSYPYCQVNGQLIATSTLAPLVTTLNEFLNPSVTLNTYNSIFTDVTNPTFFDPLISTESSPSYFSKYLVNSSSSAVVIPNQPTKLVIVSYVGTNGPIGGITRQFNIVLPNDNNPIPSNLDMELTNPHPFIPTGAYANRYETSTFKADLILHYTAGDVTIPDVIVETAGFYFVYTCDGSGASLGAYRFVKQYEMCRSLPTAITPPSNCLDAQIQELQSQGSQAWIEYLNLAEQEFVYRYKKACLKGVQETMTMELPEKAFAVTLYYYDQADNLVMTIPPEGVNKKTGSTLNYHDFHLLITEYKYDSENKLLASTNPDHLNEYTEYYYSDKSRLMASANPKQKLSANNSFSYTSFDKQERLIEAGESNGLTTLQSAVFDEDYLPSDGYEYVLHKLLELQTHKDISHTWYDAYPDNNVTSAFTNPSSFYNRNRVTASAFFNSTSTDWTTATNLRAFAYDEHGLVPEQVNIMPELYNQTWSNPVSIFRTEYRYNIFSGLMDTVIYQRGKHDQFLHHYKYDQDLRISFTYTSKNNVVWDQDARYIYYPHGPLARTELGHDKIQGTDYAYTLQGWLKMINGNSLGEQYDMGQDGSYGTIYAPPSSNVHQKFAYDAYGFSLNYYNHGIASGGAIAKDYSPVTPRSSSPLLDETTFPFIDTPDPSEVGQDLYNGNITGSTTTFYDIDPNSATFEMPIPMASFYRYDQMNRLKKVQSYDHSNHQGTAWDQYTADDRYQMQLTYDMNGNILTLQRNGNDNSNLVMDNFNYKYFSLNSSNQPQNIQLTGFNGNSTNKATNRLSLLEEDISLAANYNADVDGLSGTGNVNYSYDELGNLTQDLSEEIEEIKWNAYGKVVEVLRTSTCQDKPDLVYVYDAFGQRIKKIVKQRTAGQLSHEKDWQETYYLRDAQGNVMAMYSHNSNYNSTDNSVSESFRITEWDLYGSSRLGIRSADKATDILILAARNYTWTSNTVSNEYILPTTNITYKKYRVLGLKTFELTNHLGNVISTVSDRKLMIEDPSNTGYVHHYVPEILSIGEQYAFGMSMPGRTFSVENYRYGFNGKENQDELLGEDNAQDFGARMYDARVGRWWGLDQKRASFPSHSGYEAYASNPIFYIDVDGKYFTGNLTLLKSVYDVALKSASEGNQLMTEFVNMVHAMMDSDIEFNINDTEMGPPRELGNGEYSGGITRYNAFENMIVLGVFDKPFPSDRYYPYDPIVVLAHEIVHGFQFLNNESQFIYTNPNASEKSNGGKTNEYLPYLIQNEFAKKSKIEGNIKDQNYLNKQNGDCDWFNYSPETDLQFNSYISSSPKHLPKPGMWIGASQVLNINKIINKPLLENSNRRQLPDSNSATKKGSAKTKKNPPTRYKNPRFL